MSAASWPWSAPAAPADGAEADTGLLAYFRSGLSGYVPLRSGARSNEEEAYLSLSHWERFLGFLACLGGSALCFLFAFLFVSPPILLVRPHKFALAFTLGSLLFMAGFAVLTGPIAHLRHLLSPERRAFSIAYLASMALTLYFALGPKSRLPTVLCAVVQIGCLLTYLANYFPGGLTTLRYAGTFLARGGSSLLPI
ncbi:hypothetical protein MCAP1_002131 [Malassezia caprae]|uniref:Protein transport protein SFT2 n=1 Tax=Malassezia caprae TaxID=1381934 RepID=A0AAF0E6V6_9BASI|nr:hypothetical protein MCAP1_002131 [Malassezia caprae]